MAEVTLKEIREYFKKEGDNLTAFGKEWRELSEKDKADIKQGFGDGSLTY